MKYTYKWSKLESGGATFQDCSTPQNGIRSLAPPKPPVPLKKTISPPNAIYLSELIWRVRAKIGLDSWFWCLTKGFGVWGIIRDQFWEPQFDLKVKNCVDGL